MQMAPKKRKIEKVEIPSKDSEEYGKERKEKEMKKIIGAALIIILTVTLAACGKKTEPEPSGSETKNPAATQTPSDKTVTPDAPEQTPTDKTVTPDAPKQTDTNTPASGSTTGEITTGGEVGAAAPSDVVLPQNVRMEVSLTGNPDQTSIKIGNDFYTKDRYGDQYFFKYMSEDEWTQYDMEDGAWVDSGSCDNNEVVDQCFGNIRRYDDLGVELSTTGRTRVIAGVNTKEYQYVLNDVDMFCWLSDDGITFNHNDLTVITLFDTSAASFGFPTP